jgi:ABC-type lipoprotein export system ATPase subunit
MKHLIIVFTLISCVSVKCSFNLLQELDISQNLELKSLIYGNNKLTNLNVALNSKLRQLNFRQNSISTIN